MARLEALKSFGFALVLAWGSLVASSSGQSMSPSSQDSVTPLNGQVPIPAAPVQPPIPPESAFNRQVLDTFLGRGMDEFWDISALANKYNPGLPVAIHFSEWGQPIDLGNALEQRSIDQPFELVIGFYEKLPNSSEATVVAVHDVKIDPAQWQKLWGKITAAEIKQLQDTFRTGIDKNALFYARGEASRIRMKGAVMQLDPRINRSKREIACFIPFGIFNTQILNQPAPVRQQGLTLWGRPFKSKIDLGSKPPETLVAAVDRNGKPVPFKTVGRKPDTPKMEVNTSKTVLNDVKPSVPGSVEASESPKATPAEIEAAIAAAQQGKITPNTVGVVNEKAEPPPPPPPIDTGWSRIDVAPVKIK